MNAARKRLAHRQAGDPSDVAEALQGILTLMQWQQQLIQDLLQKLEAKSKRRRA